MSADALYDVELKDFVAARDALAKKLRADGDNDAAAAVKGLRKPSTVAWAINRTVRAHANDVDELIRAAANVRAAQVRAVHGNDAGGLRDASKAWRTQINRLAAAVAELVGNQYRDEAAATFEASSVDEVLAEMLKAGRFTAAVTAAGFGLAGMPDPPACLPIDEPTVKEPAVDEPTLDEPAVDESVVDESARTDASNALAASDKALEKAGFRLRRAEQRLDQARAAVDEARLAYSDAQAARDAAARALLEFTSS